ncbi:hypothetical protein PR003_g26904 [Phytophthora rubi]|uniref:RxLR effector protein n=1 Tax=Phytophthora rubi TaxID=129364 RepID=A0A6A3IU51_9STRA|nr:hypothetical protein PR002_g26863 [Phytophthora rubi]KAE8985541.1 hypothetical protein PR001_g22860 [Phytophthora rubi]KAE9284232.1 hypothetical protein PR003_g26904 [Phytophthora rubi]
MRTLPGSILFFGTFAIFFNNCETTSSHIMVVKLTYVYLHVSYRETNQISDIIGHRTF